MSAVQLTEEQSKQGVASLSPELRYMLEEKGVDADLIAGFVVQAGDLVIDGSFKSKLNRLADTLQA